MNDSNDLLAQQQDDGPWYKQSWAWFVLTPLITVVFACTIFVTLAVKTSDDVVKDNYYKEGRLINQHFTLDKQARELGLDGRLQFDLEIGEVVLDVTSKVSLPEVLALELSHPIKSQYDVRIELKEIAPGRYVGGLEKRLSDRWYVRLQAEAITDEGVAPVDAWRLNGEIDLDRGQVLVFSEQAKSNVIDLPEGVEPVEVTAAREGSQH